jgi:hypothetical protein
MFDKQDAQHLEQLLLISKMRNLANDISHNQSVLTAKIFGAMTTRQFLTATLFVLGCDCTTYTEPAHTL